MCGLFVVTCKGVKKVPQLVRVNCQVKICRHACDIFAVEVIGGAIDVPHTPVGIVVTVGAGAEWSLCP